MEKIKSVLRSKTFGFVALVAIVTAIPLTVMTAQKTQETRQQAAEITPTNTIYIQSPKPQNGSYTTNPVAFSGTIVDQIPNLIGPRYVSIYIDGKKLQGEGGYLYERRKDSAPILIQYASTSSSYPFSVGKHYWFVRLSSPDGSLYVDTPVYTFAIGNPTNPTPKPSITPQYSVYPTPTFYITPPPKYTIMPTPSIYNNNRVDIRTQDMQADGGYRMFPNLNLIIIGPTGYISAKTNDSGYYAIQNAKPGNYTIYLNPVPAGYSVVSQNPLVATVNTLPAALDIILKKQ